jgi:sugar phosphate permease
VTLFLLLKRVDRLNAAKVYGAAVAATGLIVITMGSVGGSTAAATCFAVYYLGYGVIWATNSAALNAAVDRNLRESAFALAGMAATVGTFAVGIVHWQMLEFHISLPDVYRICGLIATLAGVVLFVVGRKR